jgi:hypothetical protein
MYGSFEYIPMIALIFQPAPAFSKNLNSAAVEWRNLAAISHQIGRQSSGCNAQT